MSCEFLIKRQVKIFTIILSTLIFLPISHVLAFDSCKNITGHWNGIGYMGVFHYPYKVDAKIEKFADGYYFLIKEYGFANKSQPQMWVDLAYCKQGKIYMGYWAGNIIGNKMSLYTHYFDKSWYLSKQN